MLRKPIILSFILLSTLLAAQQSNAPAASGTQAIYQAEAKSAQKNFDHIEQNGARAKPDQTPTVITENQLNAWFASGQAKLPQGVKKLQLRGNPGVISGTAFVDFDEITAGRRSGNPLLGLFTGTHQVEATAHAQGSAGQGQVHIDSVSLDGVPVPRVALQFFVDKYIKPKHPEIGLDTTFQLPNKIDIATVGVRNLTITQK
jgi:hypothetical protein